MEQKRRPVRERTTASVKAKTIQVLKYVDEWNSLPAHYTAEVVELLESRGLFNDLDREALTHKIRQVKDNNQFNLDIALAIYTIAHKYHLQSPSG